MKKLLSLSMVMGLAIVGFVGLNSNEVEASTTWDYFPYNGVGHEIGIDLRTDANTYHQTTASTVEVSMTLDEPYELYNWEMYVEKQGSNGWYRYYTAGTIYGYVSQDSPSYRSFNMSDFTTGDYRVRIEFTSSNGTILGNEYDVATDFTVVHSW